MRASSHLLGAALLANAVMLAGCASRPLPAEQAARREATEVTRTYRPEGRKPALPVLSADSPPADYVRFALLNHSQVEAAYYDWRAAVEAIAPARALPDPQITFQADITDTLMSLMPGLMFDIMAPGKRAAMGREATASSAVAYRAYATAVIGTAAEVRKAWVELAYLEEALALRRQSAALLEQSLAAAQADYATGRGMGTLEEQTKILNETGRLKNELAGLAERRTAARARFKSALGLRREDADPVWPTQPFPSAPLPDDETLWRQTLAANPQLAGMRAMVEMTVAQTDIARRARTPDFTAGLMVDLKADPLMFRPTATMTLPVWREKIAGIIASADARRLAAEARLNAEQLSMATDLAQMLFMVREADRMAAYLDDTALPNLARALASAQAAYQSGMGGFGSLAELRLMQLAMQLERADARREREAARADLSLLVAGDVPAAGLLNAPTPSPRFSP
jgi:cobalt-zinc-cadmium efflux system outer membrane protein